MAAPVLPLPLPQRRFTRSEYDRLVESGIVREDEKLELMGGILVAMPPIGTEHADAVRILTRRLVLGVGEDAFVFVQSPFAASDDSEPEPDLLVVPAGEYRHEHPRAARLVIEVSDSTLAYDRDVKAPLYAASGVPEYWIVNLRDAQIEVHTEPRDGRYASVQRFEGDASVSPHGFPAVVVTVRELCG